MHLLRLGTGALFALILTTSSAGAQQGIQIDGNKIMMRGCVAAPAAQLQMPFETLMWSRGGILTAGTAVADDAKRAGGEELRSRVLFWIDEDDLAKHAGEMVEVRGELEELKTGELEIERDGDFTKIQLDLDGRDETIRVPTAWLDRRSVARASGDRDDDIEIKIATRKVDIDDVKVLGRCPGR